MLTLRLRLPGGQSSTLQLSGSSSVGELRERAAALSSLPLESLQLSVGFPPAPLAHASLPESEAPLSDVVVNMDTVTVSDGAASGQASAPAGKKMPKPKKQPTGSSSGSRVHTLSTDGGGGSGGSGGGSGGSARKRSAAPGSAGGGGGAGAKRRAPKALQLGSEDGIGDSLLAAVSSGKGTRALHREDPALAFFKAAAGSALVHHQEEVLANQRFKAALGMDYHMRDATDSMRADGEAAECSVIFKIDRHRQEERFALLAVPELRGVIQAVLTKLSEDPHAEGGGLQLLKPFKMAHVSPRIFWSVSHTHLSHPSLTPHFHPHVRAHVSHPRASLGQISHSPFRPNVSAHIPSICHAMLCLDLNQEYGQALWRRRRGGAAPAAPFGRLVVSQ